MRSLLVFALTVAGSSALAQPPKKPTWYDKAVKKVEATFEPAEAKPGQVVTLKVTVELNPGYYTYPVKQTDKNAVAMVNKLVFPDKGSVIFVGTTADPADPKTKAEPDLGIKELRYYPGKVVYERKAVVAPTQKPGPVTVQLPEFRLTVCDADNCYPSKKLTPEATLKVLEGPAVPIDAKYADEVKKAGGGM